ncbi:MAG TPA: malonate transporter subunit MadM, partial [Pseudomonas sp.]|nr:malonate transporter subunit MadM [Pseudomonas sp.]
MNDIVTKALQHNGLVAAFALIGLIMW